MTLAKNRAGVLALARAALRAPGAPGSSSVPGPEADAPIEARGRGEVHGVPVTWTRTCDSAGRALDVVDGALGHACGFDGARGWRVDVTGMPGPLELGDLEELIVSAAVWHGAWCREGGPVTVEDAVTVDGARVWLALRAGPPPGGHRRFRLADRRAHRAPRTPGARRPR